MQWRISCSGEYYVVENILQWRISCSGEYRAVENIMRWRYSVGLVRSESENRRCVHLLGLVLIGDDREREAFCVAVLVLEKLECVAKPNDEEVLVLNGNEPPSRPDQERRCY